MNFLSVYPLLFQNIKFAEFTHIKCINSLCHFQIRKNNLQSQRNRHTWLSSLQRKSWAKVGIYTCTAPYCMQRVQSRITLWNWRQRDDCESCIIVSVYKIASVHFAICIEQDGFQSRWLDIFIEFEFCLSRKYVDVPLVFCIK